nr:single-stranded DNA-binding protein [Fodinicola feengrottensis]
MSIDPTMVIVGNLTEDPELRFSPNGTAWTVFTVAHNKRRRDKAGNWVDGDPLFMRCKAWREIAENIAASLTRGSRVVVSGRLEQSHWETATGEKRSSYGLAVDDLGPSLKFATATTKKVTRTKPPHHRWRCGW